MSDESDNTVDPSERAFGTETTNFGEGHWIGKALVVNSQGVSTQALLDLVGGNPFGAPSAPIATNASASALEQTPDVVTNSPNSTDTTQND